MVEPPVLAVKLDEEGTERGHGATKDGWCTFQTETASGAERWALFMLMERD